MTYDEDKNAIWMPAWFIVPMMLLALLVTGWLSYHVIRPTYLVVSEAIVTPFGHAEMQLDIKPLAFTLSTAGGDCIVINRDWIEDEVAELYESQRITEPAYWMHYRSSCTKRNHND